MAISAGIGFITYAAVKDLRGKENDCSPEVYVIALLFVLKCALI